MLSDIKPLTSPKGSRTYAYILVMYSLYLLVTVAIIVYRVIDDMDSSDTSLLTSNGDCTQELVNLLLCGKAASNVFNDSMELTQGLGKTILLKGVPTRSDVGFLSLLEHTRRRYQVSRVARLLLLAVSIYM